MVVIVLGCLWLSCSDFCFLLQSFTGSALAALVKGLPEALQRQYEYEDPIVRGGKQLLHSPFFKVGPAKFSQHTVFSHCFFTSSVSSCIELAVRSTYYGMHLKPPFTF